MFIFSKLTLPVCCLACVTSAFAANTPPSADFTVTIDNNYIKAKSKVSDPDVGDSIKYKWTFGDGKSAVSMHPGHTYAKPGSYVVRLKVSDGKASIIATKNITIPNNSPVPDFDISSQKSLYVKFNSKSSDAEGDDLKYKWNFGDGKSSSAQNPGHTYASSGTYNVTLSVSDGFHKASKIQKEVIVKENHVPQAGFTVTKPKADNKMYVKVTSNAVDIDGDALKYKWNFGDGQTSSSANPGHTYTEVGTYTITQKVSDGLATATFKSTVEISETNRPPVAGFDIDKQNNLYVHLISFASDPDNDVLKYKWDFGDRSTSTAVNPAHTYAQSGTYTIKLRVSDGKVTDTFKKTITVSEPLPDLGKVPIQIIDGYLSSSEVCISIDGFNCLEGDMYLGVTNDEGKVFFDKRVLKELSSYHGKIKIIAKVKKNSKDIIAGEETKTTKDAVFTRILFDSEVANAEESIFNIVSPFSTLVDLSAPNTKNDYDERLNDFATYFGEENGGQNLHIDYNYENNRWLIVGEFLTRLGYMPSSTDNLKEKIDNNLTFAEILKDIEALKVFVNDVLLSDKDSTKEAIEDTHEQLGQSFKILASGLSDDWRCGITQTNNAYCWGLAIDWCSLGNHEYCAEHDKVYDKYHPLQGADEHMYSYTPVPVEEEIPCPEDTAEEHCYAKIPPVRDLSFSYTSACAVTLDGYVYCWGENFDGEGGQGEPVLADGSNSHLNVAKRVVNTHDRAYDNPYLNNIKQVVHGQKFACALSNEGEVFCWGINGSMQLGSYNEYELLDTPWQSPDNNLTLGEVDALEKPIVDARKYSPTPIKVPFPSEVETVTKLFAGYDITCAIVERNDGDPHNVYCWGNDAQLLITNNPNNLEEYFRRANDAGYFAKTGEGFSSHFFEIVKDGMYNHEFSESECDCLKSAGGRCDLRYLTICTLPFPDVEFRGPLGDSIIDDYISFRNDEMDENLIASKCFISNSIDKRTYSYGYIEPAIVESCVGPVQYRIIHIPYLMQKGKESKTIYPMNFASVGPTNNPSFENAVDITIGGTNLATQICAIVPIDETTKVKCLDYSSGSGFYPKISESFIKDSHGVELSGVSRIFSTEYAKYVMTDMGLLYSIGSNYLGVLGVSKTGNGNAVQINLYDVISLSTNKHSVCATTRKNNVKYDTYCWGSSMYGQTGYRNGDDYPWQWITDNDNWKSIFENSENFFTKPTPMGEFFIFENPKE